MRPIWLEYPHISRHSIGWQMGDGEDYSYKFIDWFESLTMEEKENYMEKYPEPKGWLGWYCDRDDLDYYDQDEYLLWNENGKIFYMIDDLRKDFINGKKFDYLFFWGHHPSSGYSVNKFCLSQWWLSDFMVETNKYCCMEQYMMAEKARIFNDKEVLAEILSCSDPKKIKALGRKVKNFSNDIWDNKKYSIALNGNYAKFIQNKNLMNYLINTQGKIIVEASPYDRIWGIGMAEKDEKARNPLLWRGSNLLGFVLMEVRQEIIRVCDN